MDSIEVGMFFTDSVDAVNDSSDLGGPSGDDSAQQYETSDHHSKPQTQQVLREFEEYMVSTFAFTVKPWSG